MYAATPPLSAQNLMHLSQVKSSTWHWGCLGGFLHRQQVLRGVTDVLENRFGIGHTTVQVEVEGCDPNDMYCTLRALRKGQSDCGHSH